MMSIAEQEKRKPGRPRKQDTRAERTPGEAEAAPEQSTPTRKRNKMMDQFSGPLHIANPDPDYVYRWPVDSTENGVRLFKLIQRDWEFVTKEDNLQISDSFIYNATNVGSIYRVPASTSSGKYHYLMKIRKEWYDEDQAQKAEKINRTEKGLFKADKNDGQYGTTRYE